MNIKKGTALLCTAALFAAGTVFELPAGTLSAEEYDYSDDYDYSEDYEYSDDDYESSSPLRGDVNLDGKVDQLDATLILKEITALDVTGKSVLRDYVSPSAAYTGFEEKCYRLGDVDLSDDGLKFSATDATYIMKAVLKADMEGKDEITDEIWKEVTGVDYQIFGFLWCADAHVDGIDVLFDSITEDTDIVDITFRVRDDAPDGLYELKHFSDSCHAATFCNADAERLIPEIYNGVIGVGREVEPVQYGDEFSYIIGSASVKQGDTFTISCSIKNLKDGVVAFNNYIKFDRNIFELIGAEQSAGMTKGGDFATNFKRLTETQE